MARSLKKSFFCNLSLLRHLKQTNPTRDKPIKTFSRSSVVNSLLMPYPISIYNGRSFLVFNFSELSRHHKLGEYAMTRAVYVSKMKKKQQKKTAKKKSKKKK